MHEARMRVRFCETDALGHVNNTSYFIYLEDARVQFFEALGYSMSSGDWPFILARATCDFRGQAYFNEHLIIKTAVLKIGSKSFTVLHEITEQETGRLIAEGEAVIVTFNFKTQATEAMPEHLKEQLKRFAAEIII
ncbi:acyl-CoA thioesterase [Metabacillus idriensis]|uniref:Acyl-CoA thioesterase n=1 Tax=Metabacillus idriensis TaxID=324768 RepID=A0A6I2MCH5_9BACI|nr:thioesterase family protein [Metabacillus idriensis]MCM3594486.1 acyl-CoA thioesterase [Metabacillus idriensis]MRX53483.1 acyl-CoA thioesterase [Metabacillus idriensis]OHR73067.1 thioesterase [Bacillus sp. HMSC76G11]